MVMARFNQDLLPKPELEAMPEAKKPAGPDKSADAKKQDAKSADAKGKDAKSAPKADAKSDAKDARKDDAKKDDAKKDTLKSADAKSADAKSKSTEAGADKDAGLDQEALDAERDRVEAANKRKQVAFDEKVKQGEQKAKELNARFADWYYVVGEDTYRKIHVGKSDIIKKKPKDTKDSKDSAAGPPTNPFNLNALPGATK
jgi:hypothetical protein